MKHEHKGFVVTDEAVSQTSLGEAVSKLKCLIPPTLE